MKRIFLFILVALTIASCKQPKEQTAKGALSDLLTSFRRHKSVSYVANMRTKYFGRNDTIKYRIYCKLIRDKRDTIFGGYLYYSSKDGNYNWGRYFDLDSIYWFDDSLKYIKVYNDPKNQYGAITGNGGSKATLTYFLDTSDLYHILKDSSINKTFSEDKIGDKTFWKVSIKIPDDSELKNQRTYIWINPEDTSIRKIVRQRVFQNQESFLEWNLDSLVFDADTPQSLKDFMHTRMTTYKMERYIPVDETPLANGAKSPDFSGTEFSTGKRISLSNYKGKIVLLDFWYMDCIWCIRAMPTIEKIRDEFSPKGLVVLGINSFDTNDVQKNKLPDFIKINKNTYPTILTSRSTDKLYKVRAYPTLYLINQKGDVAFSDIGFSPKLDSTLSAEIDKLLKK